MDQINERLAEAQREIDLRNLAFDCVLKIVATLKPLPQEVKQQVFDEVATITGLCISDPFRPLD